MMKCLLIFALASLTFDLVQNLEGIEEKFMCLECEGYGRDYAQALKDCDDNTELETCEVEGAPLCAVGSFRKDDGSFKVLRGCLSRSEYNEYNDDCKNKESCAVAMCDKSRYKPEPLY